MSFTDEERLVILSMSPEQRAQQQQLFFSPNKKARVTPSARPEGVPQFRSVDQLFREEFLNTDLHILEGYVLFAPEGSGSMRTCRSR